MTNKWLLQYEQFLLKNASQISSIESSLRSLVLILPGRFQDAEIASESVSSVLQIIGLYHDSILAKAARSASTRAALHPDGPEAQIFKESQHNRYTTAQSEESAVYKVVSLTLTITRYTELLVETVLRQKKGDRARWRAIVAIEAFKTALRLVLVSSTQRIVVSPPIPEREFDPQQLEAELARKEDKLEQEIATPPASWCMPRTGKYLPSATPNSPAEVQAYLTQKVLTTEDVCKPTELMHSIFSKFSLFGTKQQSKNRKGIYAEILYNLRPLLYALAAYKFRNRPRNWTPWALGLVIELYARRLQQQFYQEELGRSNVTSLEKDEARKRTAALWWWMFRGAMYETRVRPVLHRMASRAESMPLVSLFGSLVQDYLYLLDHYHFASSTL